jgi:hypothetical protein
LGSCFNFLLNGGANAGECRANRQRITSPLTEATKRRQQRNAGNSTARAYQNGISAGIAADWKTRQRVLLYEFGQTGYPANPLDHLLDTRIARRTRVEAALPRGCQLREPRSSALRGPALRHTPSHFLCTNHTQLCAEKEEYVTFPSRRPSMSLCIGLWCIARRSGDRYVSHGDLNPVELHGLEFDVLVLPCIGQLQPILR